MTPKPVDLSGIGAALLAIILTSRAAVADEISSYAAIEPSLALVVAGEGNKLSFATAFCVESVDGYGFLLTNRHVLGTDPHPRIVLMSDLKHVHTSAVVRLAEIDAVVLAIKTACAPVTIGNTMPPVGTRIALAGFPAFQIEMFGRGLGLTPSFHEGTISSIIGDGAILQYDAQTDHGNSGSPLFDIESGEVYGLVTAVNTGTTGALQNNIAVGSVALQTFLQNANHDITVGLGSLRRSTEGNVAAPASPNAAQQPELSSAGRVPRLTFQNGVNRLIGDAASLFLADRGAKTHDPAVKMSFFTMSFNISGYSNCEIIVDDNPARPPSATCTAYYGNDMTEAKQAYESAKATLAAFAQDAGGAVTEKVLATPIGTRVLTSAYDAGGGVTVRLVLDLDLEPLVSLSIDAPSR